MIERKLENKMEKINLKPFPGLPQAQRALSSFVLTTIAAGATGLYCYMNNIDLNNKPEYINLLFNLEGISMVGSMAYLIGYISGRVDESKKDKKESHLELKTEELTH